MELKDRFKIIREKLGLSQKEFAENLNLKDTTISKYETGIVKPASDILTKIGNTYNISLDYLLTGKGEAFLSDQGATSRDNIKTVTLKRGQLLNIEYED